MNVSIIGVGAMGGAIADGLFRAAPEGLRLALASPSPAKLERFSSAASLISADNVAVAATADVVVIAVKPWLVKEVCTQLRPLLEGDSRLVVSVAAGVPAAEIASWTGTHRVVVAIPNIAAALGLSMTFVAPGPDAAEADALMAMELFSAVGSVMQVKESLLGAGTTLASCGIAYALRYIRAAVQGGVELGFRAAEAQRIVAQTVKGAAALLDDPAARAEDVIDSVTTPGGLTIRGLNAMEKAGFSAAVVSGLKAGVKS